MFVEIDNKNMNAFKVEEWINRTRDANGGVISPEFAMEILGKTNHFAHIKKVLKNIKENCKTKEDILPYKEFILSCVDGREMSPQALEVLQDLADTCGVRDEFDEINSEEPKWYKKDDCDIVIVISDEEFEALDGGNLRIFFDADMVCLRYSNLEGIKALKFREGADVDLSCSDLPKELDLSMCSKVILEGCDLSVVEKIKFREDAEVDLSGAKSFPEELDVSMCSMVKLCHCNLSRVKKIKFREGGVLSLSGAYVFPKELDVSMCSKVYLNGCNLKGVEKIKFREGAEVYLSHAYNFPKELDLSMCSKVNLSCCDLEGVERIKFKDKAQEKEFMDGAENFTGKVEYVGDDEKGKVMPMNNGGMEV